MRDIIKTIFIYTLVAFPVLAINCGFVWMIGGSFFPFIWYEYVVRIAMTTWITLTIMGKVNNKKLFCWHSYTRKYIDTRSEIGGDVYISKSICDKCGKQRIKDL